MKVCISVDLDNYQDYESLVDQRREASPPSFYSDALPRFLDLFDRLGVRATFFVIGRDLAVDAHRRRAREILERGHEVGNHSHTHPYHFRGLGRVQKASEIDAAEVAIADALGERPVGFRTPSCDVDSETLELLEERGYLYDSSVFPTPVMWAFMLYGKLFVRRESYQLGQAAAVFAPPRPYLPRADKLYRERSPGLTDGPLIVEIPISVSPVVRFPFYSTFARLFGRRVFDLFVRMHGGSGLLHMLFHLIEMAELRDTSLAGAMANTPGIGLSYARRREFAEHAVELLSACGPCVPMREIARDFRDARGAHVRDA